MKLSKQTDFAIRALIFIAVKHQENAVCKIDDIAEKFTIPKGHLTKVIHKLGQLGYILTIRGRAGGLKLHETTWDVRLSEIVIHFEETLHMVACNSPPCALAGCHIDVIFSKAADYFMNKLAEYTVRDALPKSGGCGGGCSDSTGQQSEEKTSCSSADACASTSQEAATGYSGVTRENLGVRVYDPSSARLSD